MAQRKTTDLKTNLETITIEEFNFFVVNGDNRRYLKNQDRHMGYFIACLQGGLTFGANETKQYLKEGEALLVPQYISWMGEISAHTQVLIHAFNPQNDKIRHIISGIYIPDIERCSLEQGSNPHILKSSYILNTFVKTVFFHYSNNIADNNFWNLKHQELIYLLAFYYPNDTIDFFQALSPGISAFQYMVLRYSPMAKNCSELAESCGYTLKAFSKLFKKEFGQSVYRWLQERKAEQIEELITQSDISLKNIMYEFEFTSASHLNKFCKKYFGDTPTSLRQNIKEGNNV